MKQIKLLRDHHAAGKFYPAGETIEVTNEQYKFLIEYYKRIRSEESAKELEIGQKFVKAGVLNDATSD